MKLGQLPQMGNIFEKYFAWFGGLGPKSSTLLIYQPTAIYPKPISKSLWPFTILEVCNKTVKNSKHLLKVSRA